MEKFLNYINPVTDYIDSGRLFRQPFQWLYYILGVICALSPIYALIVMIDNKLFKYAPGDVIFGTIVLWVVLVFIGLACGLIWFNRAKKLPEVLQNNARFVAVPAIANLIQTSGEVAGIFIGVFGFICCLVAGIFDVRLGIFDFTDKAIGSAIICVLYGYILIIVTRYVAELILAIADIANNTDKIARK